jgi:dTDP-4-dehydrorhamnose 3,5-epimerase-like enzyme
MAIEDCKIINFRKILDPRGNLTSVEGAQDIPFEIKRIYYLYDVPGGAYRAGHAHKELEQVFIAMSGSFDVLVKDGLNSVRHHLNRSYYGLYLPRMLWREVDNFSSGSVCLVLASRHYEETDYFRDYDAYIKAIHA